MPAHIDIIDIGEEVVCDFCNSDENGVGGLLFESKAACPTCAPRIEASAKQYGEEHFIRDRAHDGETFHQAVLRWRGGDNTIVITSFTPDKGGADAS